MLCDCPNVAVKFLKMYIAMSRYYPNKWKQVKALSDKEIPRIPFDALYEKAHDLHPAFTVIIRAEHFLSGKIQEHSYKRMINASKKIDELIAEHEITIVTDDYVGQVVPKFTNDFDDDYPF